MYLNLRSSASDHLLVDPIGAFFKGYLSVTLILDSWNACPTKHLSTTS